MTPEDILQAAQEGKALQYYNNSLQEWKYVRYSEISLQTLAQPNIVFRIKPEPKSKAQEFEKIRKKHYEGIHSGIIYLIDNLHERIAELEKGGDE